MSSGIRTPNPGVPSAGITAPGGFVAAGVACGIKSSGDLDLALVATDDGRPVPAAGVFTPNKASAAPVLVSRAHLDSTWGRGAAVVLNSGCANAATGTRGRSDAERMCELVAAGLECDRTEVLVCSTGLIGYYLPMAAVESGVGPLVAAARPDGGADAARAIMTTDTVRKQVVVHGSGFTVGGMAKGAAMLAPDMATMLAVLTTDAQVDPGHLRAILREAVTHSFNELIVDGATSTNDTVILLASGRAGPADLDAVGAAVGEACADLAGQMAADAEGSTRTATILVKGAASPGDARRAARKVADSQLVQCSLYGADPYWGRIVSELGSAGVELDPDRVAVAYGGIAVCVEGVATDHDAGAVAAHMAGRHVSIVAHLGLGEHEASVVFTDLGPGYIEENKGTS
ncbi:MAG: glutamate N-acetyltransferase / amino-acid N-acetyltransferase [Actinomycetota bacterium]|nr:glutamate N-acetyltransferase / amino-acid N-acetyltransferase [Actinomycetota bacterium]